MLRHLLFHPRRFVEQARSLQMAGWVGRMVAEGHRMLLAVGIVVEGVRRSLPGLERESHMVAEGIPVEDSPVEEEGQHILPAEERRTAVEAGEHRMAGTEVAENLFSCQFCHVSSASRTYVLAAGHRMADNRPEVVVDKPLSLGFR